MMYFLCIAIVGAFIFAYRYYSTEARIQRRVFNRIRAELPSFEVDAYQILKQEDERYAIDIEICGYLVSTNTFINRRIHAIYNAGIFDTWENIELPTISKNDLSKRLHSHSNEIDSL